MTPEVALAIVSVVLTAIGLVIGATQLAVELVRGRQ